VSRSNLELETAEHRGRESAAFLQNPLFKQSVEDLKTTIFNDWVRTGDDDSGRREQLWFEWHAIDRVLQGLRKPIDEGTIAAKERDQARYQRRMENS